MSKVRFGIMGSGYLVEVIMGGYPDGIFHEYELVGILGRTPRKTAAITKGGGYRVCSTVEELLVSKPDIVAEATSVQCVRDNVQKVLSAGVNLIVFSIDTFADEVSYGKIEEVAIRHNSKVYTASGAANGFDVLHTIFLMGQAKSGTHTRKGPVSLMNIPLYDDDLMAEEKEPHVFSGDVKEAVPILPAKVNMVVAASLTTTGPEDTSMNILSVSGIVGDNHEITTKIGGVEATADIYSNISAIAGWSVVAVFKSLISPIVF